MRIPLTTRGRLVAAGLTVAVLGASIATVQSGGPSAALSTPADVALAAPTLAGSDCIVLNVNGSAVYTAPACAPTTTVAPTTTAQQTTTSAQPTTTVAPTTTAAPTTSSAVTTTVAPTTTTTSVPATTTTAPATTTTVAPTTTAPATTVPSSSSFTENFTSPSGVARFDFQLHTSNNGTANTHIAATFIGEHDMNCGDPTTHRTIHGGQGSPTFIDVSGSELIWYCAPGNDSAKGHMMTALDTVDIATLSFSPKQTFNNVTQVCWDQNMNNMGEAKWVNVFVVPAADVTRDGDLNYAAAVGVPFGGVDKRVPDSGFQFTWLRGSTMAFKGYTQTMDFWKSYMPGGMVPDNYAGAGGVSAPRFTICLNSGGNMVINRPDGTVDTRALGASFPTGPVKVIFQDASYNPTKHNGTADHLTWHWDNLVVIGS